MAKDFTNPWGQGGKRWPPKWMDSKKEGLSNRISNENDEKECVDNLGKYIDAILDDVSKRHNNKPYESLVGSEIFNDLKGYLLKRVETSYPNCCGIIFGVSVTGARAEKKFFDSNSEDYFSEIELIDDSVIPNLDRDSNNYPYGVIKLKLIRTQDTGKYFQINIGVYKNKICFV
jgi:hypothetical protein